MHMLGLQVYLIVSISQIKLYLYTQHIFTYICLLGQKAKIPNEG